ncbi:MAG: hypothetical protein ACTHN5_00945 [Phycisphaerae bacterium]
MYFCQDVDLMAWEPGVFLEGAFGHQTLLKEAAGTLTGTGLVLTSGSLAAVAAGMVAQVTLTDGSLTQLLEVVTVTDDTHATVSALRGRSSEPVVTPLTGGSVKATVVTFQPQIAAVGDALLSLVGIASDRDTSPAPASADLCGFRTAAIFGTLAAIYRTLVDAKSATNLTFGKRAYYEGLAQSSRQQLAATIDCDGDGVAEERVLSGVHTLRRA